MSKPQFPEYPVLLVDDEREWLRNLSLALQRHLGINHVMPCQDSRQALPLLANQAASLAILDMTMPHIDGHKLLVQIREAHPEIPVIILTGRNEVELAVNCMKDGAYDYFIKTDDNDRLFNAIRRALEMRQMKDENRNLKEQVLSSAPARHELFEGIVTCSARMEAIFRYVEAIAVSSEPVLITGESGVGKELLARAVHRAGDPDAPWVAVNVAGLDDNAFADTLFGHVKGAFTGAEKERTGLVEKAAGGTLFLDEIGDLEPASQIKLLRFIQEKEYYPLGSDQHKKVQARLVFATNHNLIEKVDQGSFRRDLYYRLQTHHVQIPPLRDRPEDIGLLLEHFIAESAASMNKPVPPVPGSVVKALESCPFHGNIRELRGLIFDAMSQHCEGPLTLEFFRTLSGFVSPEGTNGFAHTASIPENCAGEDFPTIKQAVKTLVLEAMERADGNRSAAARLLGISQPALSKRLKNMAEENN
ncbi:MAG: two-component system response regulator [Desulfuromonas sp.]|nr:MAG: two-component system response regulator [Desulfuromonas sp.]